jgi:hypothetical protein
MTYSTCLRLFDPPRANFATASRILKQERALLSRAPLLVLLLLLLLESVSVSGSLWRHALQMPYFPMLLSDAFHSKIVLKI